MQMIWLLMSNRPRTHSWWPPRRCAPFPLRIRVCRLLFRLEQLDPRLSKDLAPALLHVLEALIVELVPALVVSERQLLCAGDGHGTLGGAVVVSSTALAGGGWRGIISGC